MSERIHLPGVGSYYRRGRHWTIEYWIEGRPVWESVTRLLQRRPETITAKDAERCLRTRKGQGPSVFADTKRTTVQAVLDAYVEAVRKRKSASDIRGECRHLGAALGPRRASAIDTVVIAAYMEQAEAVGFALGTITKRVGYLRAAFRHARRRKLITTMPEFPPLPRSRPRQGFYDPEDFWARHRHLSGVMADLVEFYYYTGWRRDELLHLQWTMVDRVTGVLRLPDDKAGEGRVIPISAEMAAVLERRWADRFTRRWDGRVLVSPWVFHGPWGGRLNDEKVYAAWYRAADEAGLPRKGLHDFRRTVARDLVEGAGVSEKVAMLVTGHKTGAMFKQYQIGDRRDMARAQAALAAFRDRVSSRDPGKPRQIGRGGRRKTATSLTIVTPSDRS
jgi:integrase